MIDLSALLGDDPPKLLPLGPIPSTMNEVELGELLGIAASQVRLKTREGTIIRTAPNAYAVRPSLKNYIAKLRDAASRPQTASASLAAEKQRLAAAQAEKAELGNARTRGELLEAGAVEKGWTSILRDVRAGILATPSRIGSRLPHLTPHDIAEIQRELTAALASLAGDDLGND